MSRLLLDTNVVIWMLLGQRDAIPEHVQRQLSDRNVSLLVSAASVWEISIKRSLGKLDIGADWHRQLLELDVEHLAITAQHASAVEALPWHHRDPFDRLLIAQARTEGATLVTSDERLKAYDIPTLW